MYLPILFTHNSKTSCKDEKKLIASVFDWI